MAEAAAPVTAEDLAKLRSEVKSEIAREYGDTIANLRAETDRERQARAITEAKANEKPAEKPKTPQEIQALVDQGAMTQIEATAFLVRQEREAIKKSLREEQAGEARSQKLVNEIARYQKSIPAIGQSGSPERTRLTREFERLVELGLPGDATTELAALRTVFGDPDGVEERTAARPASQEDLGGSGGRGGASPSESDSSGAPKDLPAKQREFYEGKIAKGMYPGGWKNKDLQKELSYVPRTKGRAA